MKRQIVSLIAASLMLGSTPRIIAGQGSSKFVAAATLAFISTTHIAGALQNHEPIEQEMSAAAFNKIFNTPSAVPNCSLSYVTFYKPKNNNQYVTHQALCTSNMPAGYIDYSDSCVDGICARTIRYFHVERHLRNQGIGTECLRQFIQQSIEEGVKCISLITTVTAEHIYLKAGFIKAEEGVFDYNRILLLTHSNPYRPFYTPPTT